MDDEFLTRGDRIQYEISQAAYQLFLERGYHGTPMCQIAQEAGLHWVGFTTTSSVKKQFLHR